MKPNVFFLGASGVGKTTLAKHVLGRWGNNLLTGVTSRAAEVSGVKPTECLGDMAALDKYQAAVWTEQIATEAPFWTTEHDCFVSDRGVDILAYTARLSRVAWQITRSDSFTAYMERLRLSGRAVVFFVRPVPGLVPLDGRRDFFLTPEWQHGVDGMVESMLEQHEVPYIALGSPLLKDRIRTVDTVLALAKRI
jgi:AAA domain